MSPQGVASVTMGITEDGILVGDAGVEHPNCSSPTAFKQTGLNSHQANSRLSFVDRRPLCSSPLAGPALSNPSIAGLENEISIKEELPSITSHASMTVSRLQKPKKGPVRFSTLTIYDRPQSSAYVTSPPPRTSSLRRTRKPSRDNLSASLRDLPVLPYMPPPPSRSIDGMPQPFPSTSTLRPRIPSRDPYSDFATLPPYIHVRRLSTSPDPSKNWMTTNTYETTPRFSRLGMSASSVVLPIAARDYNRVNVERRPTAPSSATDFLRPAKPAPEPARRYSLGTLSSANSSCETLPVSASCSIVQSRRSSSDIGTVVEDSEEEVGRSSCASIGIGIGLSGEIKVQKGYPLIETTPKDAHFLDTPSRSPSVSSGCESVAEPQPLLKKMGKCWMAEVRLRTLKRIERPVSSRDLSTEERGGEMRPWAVTRLWRKLSGSGGRLSRKIGHVEL